MRSIFALCTLLYFLANLTKYTCNYKANIEYRIFNQTIFDYWRDCRESLYRVAYEKHSTSFWRVDSSILRICTSCFQCVSMFSLSKWLIANFYLNFLPASTDIVNLHFLTELRKKIINACNEFKINEKSLSLGISIPQLTTRRPQITVKQGTIVIF